MIVTAPYSPENIKSAGTLDIVGTSTYVEDAVADALVEKLVGERTNLNPIIKPFLQIMKRNSQPKTGTEQQ